MRSIALCSLGASSVRAGLAGSLLRAAVLVALIPASTAYGQTTFTVNDTADLVDAATGDGVCDANVVAPGAQCTLRAAVMEANALPGADTIVFDPSTNGTPFVLTRPRDPLASNFDDGTDGDLDVLDELTITGNGAASTVIQGTTPVPATDRVLHGLAPLTVSGVAIKHGRSQESGGGIQAHFPLTITDSVIADNESVGLRGGGINCNDDLILDRVTVSNNAARYGAGVFWGSYDGLLSVTNSTFESNRGDAGVGTGGGLDSSRFGPTPPVIVISNTTFSGNTAAFGCAVYHQNAPLRLHSVTVADNCTPGSGAAALVATYGDGSTGGEVRLKNSVVASGPGTDNCRVETVHGTPPGFFSEGHNLASDATCGLVQVGDVQGANPLFGPLANNGGPTRTHLPLPGSPVIDTGTPDCLPTDQRGLGRPSDGGSGAAVCDKGAVEVAAAPPPPPPTTGSIQGTAWDDLDFDGVRDLPMDAGTAGVEVCLFPTSPTVCTVTGADGTYAFSSLGPGNYHVYIRVTAGRLSSTPRARLVNVAAGATATGVDFGTFVPPPPPPAWPPLAFSGAIGKEAALLRATFLVFAKPPCVPTSVIATVTYAGSQDVSLPMSFDARNMFWSVEFPSPSAPGVLPVRVVADCSSLTNFASIVFIDPSGTILDGCTGGPLEGATVRLKKNEPFGSDAYIVPVAAEHIPSDNPEITAADGLYAWDVVPGRWRISASKPGYDTVTTEPFDVPPPKLNLDITLAPTAGCNIAPVANDDAYATDQETPLSVAAPGVLGNDTDGDNNALSAVLMTNATHGNVTLASDGWFTYTPSTGFHGTDTFTYKANDGASDSNVATVTITVRDVNRPPVARDDAYQTRKNRAFFIAAPGVLANDSDPEGSTLSAVLRRRPAHGFALLFANGAFAYLPRPDFVGTDSFTYEARDGMNTSNVATVTIEVARKRDGGDDDDDDEHDRDDDDPNGHDGHGRDHR